MRDPNKLIRPDLEQIPDELTKHARWILWKLVKKEGKDKLDKVPCNPDGYHMNAHDPGNWMSFEEVSQIYNKSNGTFSGVGFVPAGRDKIIGIDFDDCMNGDGQPRPETLKEIHSINSYTEVSPSGKGIRIFAFGDIPTNGKKDDDTGVEIYKNGRFLTVTGRCLSGMPTDVEDSAGAVLELYNMYFGARLDPNTNTQTGFTTVALFDDIEGDKSHDGLVRLAARLISKGMSRDDTLRIGHDIIKARVRVDKKESRLREWPGMVESAILKYGSNKAPCPKLTTVTFDEIRQEKPQSQPLIEDVLDRKECVLLVGPHGLGKSLLVNQICLAAGAPGGPKKIWGRFPIPRPLVSVICQSENGRNGFYSRLTLLMKQNSLYQQSFKNVHIMSYEGIADVRVRGNFLDASFQKELVDKLQELSADIVVFDPLISFHEMEENDNTGMRTVLDALQIHILDEANVGAIIPHHPPKAASGPRGAGAIGDWAHTIVELTYKNAVEDRYHIKMVNPKNRNHREFDPLWLRRTPQLAFLQCREPLSQHDQECVEQVVDVLTQMGFARTKTELVTAIVNGTGVKSDKTARKYIKLAVKHEYIIEEKTGGRGSSLSYHLAREVMPTDNSEGI